MRLPYPFSWLLACLLLPMQAVAATLGLLAPVLEGGAPLQRPAPDGGPAPVVTGLREGALYTLLQREARDGFTAHMLSLDAEAQRLAGAAAPRPTWLYLSAEDGGFARRGFWLRDGGSEVFVDEPFVDLVVDEDSVADGSFEEIFAHELGHVFLRRLLPGLPHGHSRTPHHGYSLTDYPTAFDEGFAIHFQLLSRRLTANPRLRDVDHGFDTRPYLPHWQSHRDRSQRIDGVRRNLFVHARLPLEGEGETLAREQLSMSFSATRLRNGQQMLSSEGLLATLFHRWIGPVPAEGLDGAYRPWFRALSALQSRALEPDSPLPVLLLRELHALDADAGARAIGQFIDTTYGLTEDSGLQAPAEALAMAGALGDIEAFVGGLGPARQALARVREAALADPSRLGSALGPAIWLLAEGEGAPTVNLNTAGDAELRALGLAADESARLLSERRRAGAFESLDDAVARAGLAPSVAARLNARRAAMRDAGTQPRR